MLGLQLKSSIWSVDGTSWGQPKSFQVIEDRILTESPSSTIVQSMLLTVTHTNIWKGIVEWIRDYVRLLQSKEITSVLGEDSVEIEKNYPFVEQSELTTKTSAGFSSLSTRRKGQDRDYVKVTTLVLTLSDERFGSGGYDIESTTLTSLSKGIF